MQRTEAFPDRGQPAHYLNESTSSAVSWGAIIAGAVIGAALTATMFAGGTGLGLLSVSPWNDDGVSGTTVAVGTVIWMFVTHIIAYGIAGYVTGRLRTKWTDARSDEIYFRDTAHGFLVWALSFVVGLVLFGSTAATVVSGTAKAGASAVSTVAEQVANTEDSPFSMDYFTDALLRSAEPGPTSRPEDTRREVSLILSKSLVQGGEVSEADQRYLVQVVSQRTGLSEAEARHRLSQITEQATQAADEVQMKAREAADDARKFAAAFALWAFASLLLGAFVASFSATIGGRARDL